MTLLSHDLTTLHHFIHCVSMTQGVLLKGLTQRHVEDEMSTTSTISCQEFVEVRVPLGGTQVRAGYTLHVVCVVDKAVLHQVAH